MTTKRTTKKAPAKAGAAQGAADRADSRDELLAKIGKAWPGYRDIPRVARVVDLASDDELRRMLVVADAFRSPVDPMPWKEPSPRWQADEAEAFRRVGTLQRSGEGRYTLARDECGAWYQGPDWVPFNLYSMAESHAWRADERSCAGTLMGAVGAEKLWADILRKYPRHADNIAAQLPTACADAKARWDEIPRFTPKEFNGHRDELARRAEQLATELERFNLPRDPDEHELPGLYDFQALMDQEELEAFDQAVRLTALQISNRARKQVGAAGRDWHDYNSLSAEAKALGYTMDDIHSDARTDAACIYGLMQPDYGRPGWPYGGVPTLPDMLRRIAKKFREDGKRPPIKSPNSGTAEQHFFTRELCKYFWKSYGDVSPAIVRDIVAMFYDGGVTENNVSQIVAKVKEAHPHRATPAPTLKKSR